MGKNTILTCEKKSYAKEKGKFSILTFKNRSQSKAKREKLFLTLQVRTPFLLLNKTKHKVRQKLKTQLNSYFYKNHMIKQRVRTSFLLLKTIAR